MTVLNKLVLATFLSFAMLVTAPSAFAAGKVANQTPAETVVALDDTVAVAEETLAAVQNEDSDRDDVMALFKKTKQTAKTIESSVVLSIRDKSMSRVKKARSAFKKGRTDEAIDWMVKAVDLFKQTRSRYHNF